MICFDFYLFLLSFDFSHYFYYIISDIKSYYQFNNRALHGATYNGHIEVVRLLLDRGAKIDAVGQVSHNVSIASTDYCISLY